VNSSQRRPSTGRVNLIRIKLAYALPLGQVSLATVLLLVARGSQPAMQVDTVWTPTAELLFAGLNTPAERLALILLEILPWPAGVLSADLLCLVLVAALWYLVGREIDTIRFRTEGGMPRATSTARILGNLLAALYGVYLLIVICLHNIIFTNPANGNLGTANALGDLLRQSLWFLWSIVMILIPANTLRLAIRCRRLAAQARSTR
jgi:hypothetical protein